MVARLIERTESCRAIAASPLRGTWQIVLAKSPRVPQSVAVNEIHKHAQRDDL